MGFLKKITRPISKVLDKIVPNEIKPALPFLAAAAPFMAPGIMGIGGNTMLSRALISGGLNLGSQLAQEGSEGDFSPLSVALASGIGALSAPNAASTIRGVDPNFVGPRPAPEGILGQGKEFLAKSAEFLGPQTGGAVDILGKGGTQAGLNLETARAAMVPFTQATTDLAVADARRLEKQAAIDEALAQAELLEDSGARAAAIRQFMEGAGYFTDEEIEETISAAGYANGGRVGLEFGGIPAAVEAVEEKPKEFLVDKLKVTIMPGQSEEMGILNAMFNDVEGVMPDDRKMEFYKLYIPQLYERGEISKAEFEGMKEDILGEGKKDGGRIGFRDGSSTGSFGLDRYASEMISEGNMLNKDATDFLNKYEDIVKEGKADERLFDLLKEYRTLEDKAEKTEDKFTNTKLEDKAEGIMSVDDLKYYDKKMEDIDKKLDDSDKRLNTLDEEFITKGIDASEITRTPDFQEWLELYKTDKSKAYNHPYADIYLGILGAKLKGRDKSYYKTVGFAEGGLMSLGGKEMDLRGGGFVPIGKKERADDVPARLSKNEFVMTADAVRGAGGGDINKGAKRMYETMNRLEARA